MDNLKQEIKKLIIWYDIFDYAPNTQEIWRHLPVQVSFLKCQSVLDELVGIELETSEGCYFLPGRFCLINIKKERYISSIHKYKKAKRLFYFLRFLPWLRLVAVANSIGAHNLRANGDIDIFVVASAGRVWLTRLFLVVIVMVLNLRPSEGNSRDKICLSFFCSDDSLDLSLLRLKDDRYFSFWLTGLVPIYNSNRTYQFFYQKNSWLRAEFPNYSVSKPVSDFVLGDLLPRFCYNIIDAVLDFLEKLVRQIQEQKFPSIIKELKNIDTRVCCSEKIIKLHVSDRRAIYNNKYLQRINNL